MRAGNEFEEGHVEGARNIFLGLLPKSDLPGKDEPIALICLTGDRSTVAASVLEQRGFTNVYNISGGMLAQED